MLVITIEGEYTFSFRARGSQRCRPAGERSHCAEGISALISGKECRTNTKYFRLNLLVMDFIPQTGQMDIIHFENGL